MRGLLVWVTRSMKGPLLFSSFSSSMTLTSRCCYTVSCKVFGQGSDVILKAGIWRSLRNCRSRSRSRLTVSFSAQRDDPCADENQDSDGDLADILVKMARLQAGEVEVSEFIDERSKLLTDIAEGAKTEFGRIAEDAKLSIDKVGGKVLESFDADVQALEEELASARDELEADELEFEEFESNVEKAKNAGLFFKGLYVRSKPSKNRLNQGQNEFQVEAKPLIGLTKKSARSKSRAAVYGFLVILLALTLVRTISSGDISWFRVGVYLALLFFVAVQLIYEKSLGLDERNQEE